MAEVRARAAAGALAALTLLAAVALLATLAGCGGSSGGSSASADPLAGYWVGGASGNGTMTLVHIVKDGDAYKVFANPDYPAPAATQDGDSLVIDTHNVKITFTPAGGDKLAVTVSSSASASPQANTLSRVDQTQYSDAAVSLGLATLRQGLAMWKAGGGKKYPPPSEVMPTGAISQMVSWPKNLFTGGPMQPGTSPGDYTYRRLDGGKKYSLVGHLSDGSTIGQ